MGRKVQGLTEAQFSCSVVSDSATPRTAAHHASLCITNSWSLLWSSKTEDRILCRPVLLLPSIFLSIIFSSESVLCIRWPKYWNITFSISPSSEYSGLISFRIDWLDFLAVQGTLKSLLQPYISKASVLWCSAFFMVQLSHPWPHDYWKSCRQTVFGWFLSLTRQTFVGKVMSLLFNMLSRLVIAFLPRRSVTRSCQMTGKDKENHGGHQGTVIFLRGRGSKIL